MNNNCNIRTEQRFFNWTKLIHTYIHTHRHTGKFIFCPCIASDRQKYKYSYMEFCPSVQQHNNELNFLTIIRPNLVDSDRLAAMSTLKLVRSLPTALGLHYCLHVAVFCDGSLYNCEMHWEVIVFALNQRRLAASTPKSLSTKRKDWTRLMNVTTTWRHLDVHRPSRHPPHVHVLVASAAVVAVSSKSLLLEV